MTDSIVSRFQLGGVDYYLVKQERVFQIPVDELENTSMAKEFEAKRSADKS